MELSGFIVLIGLKWSLEHAHTAAMFFRQEWEIGGKKKAVEVEGGKEMEEGDKGKEHCPHNWDAEAQKSHSHGSRCREGDV